MKVYILYLESNTYREMEGVYDTPELAKKAMDKFLEWAGTSCGVRAYIIEKVLHGENNVELK